MKPRTYLLIARMAIALVVIWNIQCALAFLIWPDCFYAGFELSGVAGETTVRGVGVLFIMWNIPYAVALIHPLRHRISLYEATAMQTIGLLGESFIFQHLPAGHQLLQASLVRFIAFDTAGLGLLLLATWIVHGTVAPALMHRKD